MARLRELPGVLAVTFDNNLPMTGKPREPAAIRAAGQSLDEEQRNPYVNWHQVGPARRATRVDPIVALRIE